MSNVWLKAKVWTKLTVFAVVLVYLLVFVFKNLGRPVAFWYWYGSEWNTSLLIFTVITFLAGVIVMFLGRTIYKTIGQFRELRRRNDEERRDRELRDLQNKAAMLQTRPDAGAPPSEVPPSADRPAP